MAKTVVGLMENIDEAQNVVRELVGSGIDRADIGFMANRKQAIPSSAGLNESEGSTGNDAAGGLIGELTNLSEEAHYYEGVRRGGILVTVAAESDAQADKVTGIMRQHGAVDIDQRATEWKQQGWASKTYNGPERRRKAMHWTGEERRRAA